ncbi:MAG: proton-conducting transporter membrane subunit [Candidatus Omnitrophota bacterium]|nr:proton-conducting transporter membrane subunit [Candidatus Omnitrophota bacterium]
MYALLVLVPFFSLLALNLPFRELNRRLAFGFAAILFLLQMGLVFIPDVYFWRVHLSFFANIFHFQLAADILSKVVLFCIGLVSLTALCVSRSLIKESEERFNFINIILLAVAGMNGVALAQDIFSLYVFLEITAVSSFILIAFEKDILGLESSFKYIVLSAVATVLMIAGIAILMFIAGSTNFSVIHSALLSQNRNLLLSLSIGLFLSALFIKAGLMPFHGWLPDAYTAAPAPVSIFLAGIVTKVAGVYCLIRIILSVIGFNDQLKGILLLVGAFSAIFGALSALTQSDFKRMLSYSSISQIGYIILGLGSGTALGVAGATLHIFNHAVFKSLLFVNSAAVESQTGSRDIDKMNGLAKQMPWTSLTSILGSLSCAGIPPLAGFWSKLVIIIALWLAGYKIYAVIAVLGSLLTLAYFLALQRKLFFAQPNDEFKNIKEAGFGLIFPAFFLAALIVGAGILSPWILSNFILGFNSLVGG